MRSRPSRPSAEARPTGFPTLREPDRLCLGGVRSIRARWFPSGDDLGPEAFLNHPFFAPSMTRFPGAERRKLHVTIFVDFHAPSLFFARSPSCFRQIVSCVPKE